MMAHESEPAVQEAQAGAPKSYQQLSDDHDALRVRRKAAERRAERAARERDILWAAVREWRDADADESGTLLADLRKDAAFVRLIDLADTDDLIALDGSETPGADSRNGGNDMTDTNCPVCGTPTDNLVGPCGSTYDVFLTHAEEDAVMREAEHVRMDIPQYIRALVRSTVISGGPLSTYVDNEEVICGFGCGCDHDPANLCKKEAGYTGPRHYAALQGDAAVEALAAQAHEAWSGWMQHMLPRLGLMYWSEDKSSWGMTAMGALVDHNFQRALSRSICQMQTPYADLPEDEKESDRAEARRYLAALAALDGSEGAG